MTSTSSHNLATSPPPPWTTHKRYMALFSVSLIVGMVSLALRYCCHAASHRFIEFIIETANTTAKTVQSHWWHGQFYLTLITVPLSFTLLYYSMDRFFIGADRGGIPQSQCALSTHSKALRYHILSLRTAAGKFVLTVLAFLSGASIGLEGPMIFLSTAITYSLSKLNISYFKNREIKNLLIVAGGAIGISTAFNTPLGGIAFVIEEYNRAFSVKLSKIIIPPIIMSTIICELFQKPTQYFSNTSSLFQMRDWLLVPTCAVLGGLLGGLFSLILYYSVRYLGQLKKRRNRVYFAAGCGLGVAIIGLLSQGNTYGSGFFETDKLIIGQGYLAHSFVLLKSLSTLLSYMSGISGGLLSPSLTIGASLGSQLTWIFPSSNHNVVIILTMLAYFSGVLQNPMTCLTIVLEMTGRSDLVVPMMATSWMAQLTSRTIFPAPLYRALAQLCHQRYRGRHLPSSNTP